MCCLRWALVRAEVWSTLSDKNSSDKSVEISAWCRKLCPSKILSDEILSDKVFWFYGFSCTTDKTKVSELTDSLQLENVILKISNRVKFVPNISNYA